MCVNMYRVFFLKSEKCEAHPAPQFWIGTVDLCFHLAPLSVLSDTVQVLYLNSFLLTTLQEGYYPHLLCMNIEVK